jgi:spore maturation protein CgeB
VPEILRRKALSTDTQPSFLFCARTGPGHLGLHFLRAAEKLRVPVSTLENTEAYGANPWVQRFYWWVLGRRPVHLGAFSRKVVDLCLEKKTSVLLATGLAPLTQQALSRIGQAGIARLNYLTDDPWNRAHGSSWFLKALPHYDLVYSTRRANMEDLKKAGCPRVEFLPFGYSPDIHFPEVPLEGEREKYDCDVSFVGGADQDRVPYLSALIQSGLKVKVYGGYWDRYPETRGAWGGFVLDSQLRKSVSGSRICLCLVRQANRDGHVMRTFELAAMGACILAEDTGEHREIYGDPGEGRVEYFTDIPDMVEKARILSKDLNRQEAMRKKVHERITKGSNTYEDRFQTILGDLAGLKVK